ncbi:MAG: hypothetical protein GY767_17885 [Shimia sp.]|nr:hypothetical protein [Shimia sp.]
MPLATKLLAAGAAGASLVGYLAVKEAITSDALTPEISHVTYSGDPLAPGDNGQAMVTWKITDAAGRVFLVTATARLLYRREPE